MTVLFISASKTEVNRGTEHARLRVQNNIQTSERKEESSETENVEKKKKADAIIFVSSHSELFPRPEFCYIKPYICSPRLRRGCS